MTGRQVLAILLSLFLLMLTGGTGVAAENTAAPDLVVTKLSWTGGDGQVRPGSTLTFSVTVKNQGTAALAEPFAVDIGFGTEHLFRLTHEVGLTVDSEITLTSPAWTAVSGDRMVTARVTTAAAEREEWDNDTLQRNLRIGKERYEPAYDTVRDAVGEAGMFDLTFNDDFNDLKGFDAGATGDEGYKWYIRRHSAFPNLKPEEYRTENGILTMDCKIDTFAIGAATIDRVTGIGYTFTQGYLEFRLRAPIVGGEKESKIAIWSFPRERYADTEKFVTHVEMDWLEYYGDNYYTVTLHEQTYENHKTHWYRSTNGNFHGLGDREWHVMGYLWEEGRLRCYLDGELYHTQTWGPDELPIPVNDVVQGDYQFDGVFSYADTQDMMMFIFGSSKIPLELDYLRVWQHGGETPVTEAPGTTSASAAKTTVTKQSTVATKRPTVPSTTLTSAATTLTSAVTTTAPTASTATTASQETAQRAGGAIVPIVAAVIVLGGAAALAVWLVKRRH